MRAEGIPRGSQGGRVRLVRDAGRCGRGCGRHRPRGACSGRARTRDDQVLLPRLLGRRSGLMLGNSHPLLEEVTAADLAVELAKPDAPLLVDVRTVMERAIASRSEEHTSELQSHHDLVCRLLLEKKK